MKTAEHTSDRPRSSSDTHILNVHQETKPFECESTSAFHSNKVGNKHLEKLAIVYVRQSTPRQVMEHRESRERQYALVDLAKALGWPSEQILVIDEDQGQSGRSADNRRGFQRVLAELTMDHSGMVLSLEMSWL